jgi:hypothetical protein
MLAALRWGLAAVLAIGTVASARSAAYADTPAAPVTKIHAAASPEPTPGTHYGSLAHLVYTATGNLPVQFLDPGAYTAAMVPAAAVVVSTVKGAGVELQINGNVVANKQLGKQSVNIKTGETQYFFYGIPLQAGPNTITATGLGADGLRGAPVSEVVYGPGDPVAVRADFGGALIANGATTAALNISMVDRWGHAIVAGNRLTVRIVRGDAHFANAQTMAPPPVPGATPTPDVVTSSAAQGAIGKVFEAPTTPGGFQRIDVVPGLTAGPLELDFQVGNAHLDKIFYISPYIRSAFVNGLLSVGAGSMPASVDGDGIDDNGGARRGRAAVYASGKVGKASLLTFIYESQNRLDPVSSYGPFTEDPNERPFLTYGDASQVTSTQHSNDHIFARLDHGQSYLQWGQFTADIGSNAAGSYTQLLSGASGSLAVDRGAVRLSGFTARNDIAYMQQTLPISGLSALTTPLQPNIVVGSDVLQLVSLSRVSGAIVSSTPLIRNVDYTIDYATGVLSFINIPLPFDANFNPQVINLQYQYEGNGVKSETTGASLKMALGSGGKTNLQFGYLNDVSGSGNFGLFTQQLSRTWDNGSWSISHADSNGGVPSTGTAVTTGTSGSALAASLNLHSTADALALTLQDTSSGYADPFGGLSTPGLLTYGANFTRAFSPKSSVAVIYTGQRNDYQGTTNGQSDASVLYNWHPSKILAFLAGLDAHSQTVSAQATPQPVASGQPAPVPLANGTQLQAHLGAQYHPSKRLGLSVEQYLTLSGSDVGSTQPTQTSAQLSYDFPNKGTIFLRELWSSQPSATFANSVSDLTTGVAATHTTEIGIERPLSPNTTVSTDYVVDATGSGTDIYSTMGIQQKFVLNKNFSGNLFAQAADAIGDGGQGFTVWGMTLGYANEQKMRAALSYQARTGANAGSTYALSVAGHLSPGLAVVMTSQRAYGNGTNAIEDRVSLAYRPVNNDRFTSLFDYQRANGSDAIDGDGIGSVLSFQELYRPWESLEIAGMLAYKLDGDAEYLAHTVAYGTRVRQDVGKRFDIGAEVQYIAVPSIADSSSTNLSLEGGYQLGNSARFALGYNFSGAVDPQLVGHPNRKGVYVTFTTLLNRVFGWGKQ